MKLQTSCSYILRRVWEFRLLRLNLDHRAPEETSSGDRKALRFDLMLIRLNGIGSQINDGARTSSNPDTWSSLSWSSRRPTFRETQSLELQSLYSWVKHQNKCSSEAVRVQRDAFRRVVWSEIQTEIRSFLMENPLKPEVIRNIKSVSVCVCVRVCVCACACVCACVWVGQGLPFPVCSSVTSCLKTPSFHLSNKTNQEPSLLTFILSSSSSSSLWVYVWTEPLVHLFPLSFLLSFPVVHLHPPPAVSEPVNGDELTDYKFKTPTWCLQVPFVSSDFTVTGWETGRSGRVGVEETQLSAFVVFNWIFCLFSGWIWREHYPDTQLCFQFASDVQDEL